MIDNVGSFMSKEEICALCLQQKPLKESHVIPKFVGKWLKDKGTGYLASAEDSSKRVQDILKIKLLCGDCEQKFSKLEKYFADTMFYPFQDDKIRKFDYTEELKQFIISMAWRCLQVVKDDYLKKETGFPLTSFVEKADKEWREILNDNSDSIDSYDTHLVFTDYETVKQVPDAHPKLHWYLLHGFDMTVVTGETKVYFYVKIPWIIFVTTIEPQKMNGWEGSIINKNGHISDVQTISDGGFWKFINDRCKFAFDNSPGPSSEVGTARLVKHIEKVGEKYFTSNIYESRIIERDNIRRKKLENMPDSIIELVEHAIIEASAPGSTLVDSQFHKMDTRRIADEIADLSEEDVHRLDNLIDSVTRRSIMSNENYHETFTSDSLHITFMMSLEKSPEDKQNSIQKECKRLKKETGGKIHIAVFSYSPEYDEYTTGCFVPWNTDDKEEK